jgi:hypothetical protein
VSRFRRRGRDEESPDEIDGVDKTDGAEAVGDDGFGGTDGAGGTETAGLRADGPWDVSEVDDPGSTRVNMGALWIPGRPGLEVRVEADPTTEVVIAVVLVLDDSALQVVPFAAPRSEGIWTDVRTEIRAGITRDGGTADEVDGPCGPELRTNVQVKGPNGVSTAQRARFIGVDGPRWFLRGVLTGEAAVSEDAANDLLELFRDVVVVRGADAMAPRDPIPLRLPTQLTGEDDPDDPDAADDENTLRPFERGPEITEIH